MSALDDFAAKLAAARPDLVAKVENDLSATPDIPLKKKRGRPKGSGKKKDIKEIWKTQPMYVPPDPDVEYPEYADQSNPAEPLGAPGATNEFTPYITLHLENNDGSAPLLARLDRGSVFMWSERPNGGTTVALNVKAAQPVILASTTSFDKITEQMEANVW